MRPKPWRQLAFVIGEAALSVTSGGVLFILISRLSGPGLLGTYALALAWLTLFQGVSSFGIPEYLMREVGVHGRDAAEQVVHAMVLGLISGLLALILMLSLTRLLGYSPYLVHVITIPSLALVPAFLTTACRSVFLALRQMHLAFLAMLIEVTIVMSASLYLLLSGYGAIALMITLVVAKAASACFTLTLLYCHVLPKRVSLSLRVLLRTANTVLAFGMGSMLGILTMRINTIMVSIWMDIATVGHYAAATKIMETGFIIPSLFVQLLMSRIAYSFNAEGNRDPNRFGAWFQALFALVIPACVGVWVFAGFILQTLFGAGFGDMRWVLRILMIYLLMESADAVMSVILQAAHRQREDVRCLASNPLTNIALNLVLLPTLGAFGAAMGRVGGVCASTTLRHRLIVRELTGVRWFRFAARSALISVAMGLICYALLDVVRPVWLLMAYTMAVGILLIMSSAFSPSAIRDLMTVPPGRA